MKNYASTSYKEEFEYVLKYRMTDTEEATDIPKRENSRPLDWAREKRLYGRARGRFKLSPRDEPEW